MNRSRNRRTELREACFLILFRADFYENKEELTEQIQDFFDGEDGFTASEKSKVTEKVLAISEKIEEIDEALNEISVGWKTRRMTSVDLTALRLAYYEIRYDSSIPHAASINEAVELAKNYGTESSGSFVNGILARVVDNEK